MIAKTDQRHYRAYLMKESLRILLKMKDPDKAEEELNHWLFWTSHSRISSFKRLYEKIKRHKEHILNPICLRMSHARIKSKK